MYKYKDGRSVVGISADVVGRELERISVRSPLTPKAIVKESEPEDAVLHQVFEWNDSQAGVLYREHQARLVVNAVTVVTETPQGPSEPVQAFISVTAVQEERVYVPARVVACDPDMRQAHLANIKSRLKNLRREYSAFSELANVWQAIDEVE